MRLYVESNFVLELAFEQERHGVCDQILGYAEDGSLSLLLPAYCLAEPYETLGRRHRTRQRLQQELQTELTQLRRSARYVKTVQQVDLAASLFAISAEEDRARLEATARRLVRAAKLIPITPQVIELGYDLQADLDMSAQDSFVLASVLRHLQAEQTDTCYFVTRDIRDFDDPDVIELLGAHGCDLLTDFGPMIRLIRARLEH
ncbi:MAG: PIN domain-containing protein [Egibacteraceae bacterium]